MLNTFVFCLPARWLWSEQGVFKLMGVVDLAGSCGVNLVGGAGALVGGAAGCVQISYRSADMYKTLAGWRMGECNA